MCFKIIYFIVLQISGVMKLTFCKQHGKERESFNVQLHKDPLDNSSIIDPLDNSSIIDPLENSSIILEDEHMYSNEVLVDPDTSLPVSKKRRGRPRKIDTRNARSKVCSTVCKHYFIELFLFPTVTTSSS